MKKQYAIGVQYDDGTCGYFIGENLKVKLYATEGEAEKTLRKMKRNDGYSWNCDVRVFPIRTLKDLEGDDGND